MGNNYSYYDPPAPAVRTQYTDTQIVNPQNGFSMYYTPYYGYPVGRGHRRWWSGMRQPYYGEPDTRRRQLCARARDCPYRQRWLNEGFSTGSRQWVCMKCGGGKVYNNIIP